MIYTCDCKRVVDGDTLVGLLDTSRKDLARTEYSLFSLRLCRIDTEELNSPSESVRASAIAAKEFVIDAVLNKTVTVECKKLDLYKRPLVELIYGGLNLTDELLAAGHGRRVSVAFQMQHAKWYDKLPVNKKMKLLYGT